MRDESSIADTAQAEAVKASIGLGVGALLAMLAMGRRRIIAWWHKPTLADALTKLGTVVEGLDKTMKQVISGLQNISDGLAVAEANVGLILDSSTVAMWWTNEHGHCIRANRALCEMFDMTEAEITNDHGMGWMRAIVPEHRERVWREFKSAISSGVPYACNYPIQTRSGLRNVVARGEVIRSRDDRILTIRGTVEPLLAAA